MVLVTCSRFRRWRIAEQQISNECTDRDREHDPAVVCHEEKPDSALASHHCALTDDRWDRVLT